MADAGYKIPAKEETQVQIGLLPYTDGSGYEITARWNKGDDKISLAWVGDNEVAFKADDADTVISVIHKLLFFRKDMQK